MFFGNCLPSDCEWFCFTCPRLLADGFIAFAYLQDVSESVLHVKDLLLMVLWHLSVISLYVNLIDMCKTSCWWVCGIFLPSDCKWFWFTCARPLADCFMVFAYLQKVSDSVWHMQDPFLTVLWQLPTLRLWVILFDMYKTCFWDILEFVYSGGMWYAWQMHTRLC